METYEYAIMAGRAYISTRGKVNRFPVPTGWSQFNPKKENSGFEAVSFRKGDEIVISFAGTGSIFNKDWLANFGLTLGNCVQQLRDAAAYYMDIKKKNADATIEKRGTLPLLYDAPKYEIFPIGLRLFHSNLDE